MTDEVQPFISLYRSRQRSRHPWLPKSVPTLGDRQRQMALHHEYMAPEQMRSYCIGQNSGLKYFSKSTRLSEESAASLSRLSVNGHAAIRCRRPRVGRHRVRSV
jgi:hypothetical protein